MKTIWSIFFLLIFSISCVKTEEIFSSEDILTSDNESSQESMTSEIDDLATTILNNSTDAGNPGGKINLFDTRFCDNTIIIFSNVNAEKTTGKVTITFDKNGCFDKKGNVRKGSIIITWSGGKWYNVGSVINVELEDYSINDVKISGNRTTTCKSFNNNPLTIVWNITANHTTTWSDGTTAVRKINKLKKWEHFADEDRFTFTNGAINAAEGINRNNKEYKIFITEPLVYLTSCIKSSKVFIPTSGEKVIVFVSSNKKTKYMTFNYGNGSCENTYTVTSGTVSKTLTTTND